MFLRDPARPRVDRFQPFGFAKPSARVAQRVLDEFQDLAGHARLRLNPELEIFEGKRGQRSTSNRISSRVILLPPPP